jgi:hypothetical protein
LPDDFDRFAAAEEEIVLETKCLRGLTVPRQWAHDLAIERDGETDLSERPFFAKADIERITELARLSGRKERFDRGGEAGLLIANLGDDGLGDAVGGGLAEESFLAFDNELLIAKGTSGEPSERQTRRQDGQDKNDRRFAHLSFGRAACPP